MTTTVRIPTIAIDRDAEASLIDGALDGEPVRGLTHGFYKYPARFSPAFARAAISAFTQPGDLCIDPHVGGGTSLVEALALGRDSIGIDVSTLAGFVSSAKTIVYSDEEITRLTTWARTAASAINMHAVSAVLTAYADLGYYKHLRHPHRWRLRKAIEQGLEDAVRLGDERLETFARCAVLRTAQWALDGRARQASVSAFREFLNSQIGAMIEGAEALSRAARSHQNVAAVSILNRDSQGIELDDRLAGIKTPKLVLTSPPYPGVHVLYHRWQVDGRKESPLPFMIAGKLDGAGSSFYTMGDRKAPGLPRYFQSVRATMQSVAALGDESTVFVQMVAFSDPQVQLPSYLDSMAAAGLEEHHLPSLIGRGDGRLWRSVPGRRWYSSQRGQTPGSNEVVLLHMRAPRSRRSKMGSVVLVPDHHRQRQAADFVSAMPIGRV